MERPLLQFNLTIAIALGFLAVGSSVVHAQTLDLRSAATTGFSPPASVHRFAESVALPRSGVRQVAADIISDDIPLSNIPDLAPAAQLPMADQPSALEAASAGAAVPIEDTYMGATHWEGGAAGDDGAGWYVPGIPADWVGCPSVGYAHASALYMIRRGNRGATLSAGSNSQRFQLGSFDYAMGTRATIGRKYDCLDGWEFSWIGPHEWTMRGQMSGTSLDPLITGVNGVGLTAFQNATFHSQSYTSKFNSFELLRKSWGWDVITQTVGVRYINIEEEFRLDSINASGDTGLLALDTNNHLVGLQYGLDLLYPCGDRWVFAAKGKVGAFGNLADFDLLLQNQGGYNQINDAHEGEFSLLGEWGAYLNYHLTPCISAHLGYEFSYIWGLALAYEQVGSTLTPFSGKNVQTDGDTLYHGATAGFDIVW